MEQELKYKVADVNKIVNAFCDISEKGIKSITKEDLQPLLDYPPEVLQKFLDAVGALGDKHITKENYYGYIGYIVIRMNL